MSVHTQCRRQSSEDHSTPTPAEPVPGCWCPLRAASTAKKTKEDPYYTLQSPSFPQGWKGTRFHGRLVLLRFCSRGDLFAFCNLWDSGPVSWDKDWGKPELSQTWHSHPTLLLTPWVALVWHTLFAPALSQCLVGSRQKGQCHPTNVVPSRDHLGEWSLEHSSAGDNARRWGCSSPAGAQQPAQGMTGDKCPLAGQCLGVATGCLSLS